MVLNNKSRKSKKRGGFLNTIKYIVLFPVYIFCKYIPKSKNLYVFGSCHGDHFADNSKYLFLYASKSAKNVRCVFISKNQDVVRLLNNCGYDAVYAYSWKGIKTAMRAKKCFISHSTHDIHSLLIGGSEIIHLWHGTPLKKICYDVLNSSDGFLRKVKNVLRKISYAIFPYLNTSMNFSKLVISSEAIKDSFKSAFRISDEKILIAGQARNDSLAIDYDFDRCVFPEVDYLEDTKKNFKFIVTWMPTHRLFSGGGVADMVNGYGFNIEKLASLLEKLDACLVVKVHFLDSTGLENIFQVSDRIVKYDYSDPYPLLRYTDILLTDYSSVYFDFLFLDRPIIFTPFDYDAYIKNDASFYYDYYQFTPGEKCSNWNELLTVLEEQLKCLSEGHKDALSDHRRKINDLVNDFPDGNSQRIVENLF